MLSRIFVERIKLGSEPAYRIAHGAHLHPATLSKLLTGAERIKPNDARVIAVGRVLGLSPDECFARRADVPVGTKAGRRRRPTDEAVGEETR